MFALLNRSANCSILGFFGAVDVDLSLLLNAFKRVNV